MSSADATDYASQVVDIVFSYTDEVTQNCATYVSQTEDIIIDSCTDVNISNIDMTQAVSIDSTCVMSATASVELQEQITTDVEQYAKAQAGLLGLDETDAATLSEQMVSLSTTILTVFAQDCSQQYAQSEYIECQNSSNVTIKYVTMDQAISDINSCVLASDAVISEMDIVNESTNQDAEASSSGLSTEGIVGLIILIAIVLIVIAVVVFSGSRKKKKSSAT